MNVKAIITDIDGTLFSHTLHKVPTSSLEAIKKLQDKGIKVIICTGRSISLFNQTGIQKLFNPDGFVSINGAYVTFNDQVVYKHTINKEDVDALIKYSKEYKFALSLLDDNENNINFIDERVLSSLGKISIKVKEPTPYPSSYPHDVYQAICFCSEEDEKKFMPTLPNCKIARWDKVGFDVLPLTSDKANGIKHLLEYMGWKNEEIIALGDGPNDIEMLTYVTHSVCMGNGNDACKKVAEYVTDSIDEDGWAKALIHYGVID